MALRLSDSLKEKVETMGEVLVAGATGYLGSYITRELLAREIKTRILVRDPSRIILEDQNLTVRKAEVTREETLKGLFKDIDTVISTIGITRQKDKLTYMDVDYRANVNLLEEAKRSGVKKFIYVSVLNGEHLRNLKICDAKERFVDDLKSSGLEYLIIRPNGFFSDMRDFLTMASGGRVFLYGKGESRLNPIDGRDLAKVIIDSMDQVNTEIEVGGPDLLSQNEIAALAFETFGKPVKVTHLPEWLRVLLLFLVRAFTREKTYGPIEFFMTTMVQDMIAPQYGEIHLRDFFEEMVK